MATNESRDLLTTILTISDSEKDYRISLAVAKRMLLAGIIDEQDYKKIDTILLEKYRPLLGCLCYLNA